jgi:DNA primase
MISTTLRDQILDAADIAQTIGHHVSLIKKGKDYTGLCPFHNEKTPSFSVSPSKRIFKCFGCGKAGNVIDFIIEHDHKTYPEAIRILAKEYNIEVPDTYNAQEDEEAGKLRDGLYAANKFAMEYYVAQLKESQPATAYTLSRFTQEMINKWQIGYAPDAWHALQQAATKAGYTTETMLAAGLLSESKGKTFDTFRNRLMFPIIDHMHRVVAFSGRILPEPATSNQQQATSNYEQRPA